MAPSYRPGLASVCLLNPSNRRNLDFCESDSNELASQPFIYWRQSVRMERCGAHATCTHRDNCGLLLLVRRLLLTLRGSFYLVVCVALAFLLMFVLL